jgi:hypothetical protein
MGNPVTNVLSSFDQPKAAAPPVPPATTPNANPVTSLLSSFDTGTSKPVVPANVPSVSETPAPPQLDAPVNPINDVLKSFDVRGSSALSPQEREQSSRPDPENNVDEPWYSKTWDWLNKPLYDAHQWGVRTGAGTIERGVESGVEDLISGLTSPLSLALTIGTLGGGTVLSGTSVGLRALGVAAEDAPVVARGLKVLMDAGFTGQAVQGLVTQSPQFLDALKDGDYETATRLGTNILAVGGLTALGAKHTFEDAAAIKEYAKGGNTPQARQTMAMAKKIAGKLDESNVVAAQKAKELQQSIVEELTKAGSMDDVTQGAIRKYMLANGDSKLLKDWHDALSGALPVRAENAEELAVREKGVELKKWLGNSKFVDSTGAPQTLFLTDSAEGTNKLGPTLSVAGDPADGHFVKMERPKDFGDLKNLQKFIADQGGDAPAKDILTAAGFDSILYKGEDGKPAVIALKDENIRPAEENKAAAQKIWNKDFVYRAVDPKNADIVRNAGLKPGEFHDTPEEALKQGTTPVSGDRSGLRIFAVPRSEVEAGATSAEPKYAYRSRDVGEKGVPSQSHSQATMSEEEAKTYMASREKITGKPQEIVRIDLNKLDPKDYESKPGPNKNDWIKFKRDLDEADVESGPKQKPRSSHMPSHEVVLDENGKPTSNVVPLRGDTEHPITLDRTRFESEYTPAEKEKLLSMYKKAQALTPEQIQIAKRMREFYDNQFNRANEKGMIRTAVENYHPQAWAKDRPGVLESLFGIKHEASDNSALNALRHQTDNGAFDTNISAAKHRAYETEFQGEMAGQKAKSYDLSYHAADYQHKLDRAIAARDFLENLRASGARASDGRPLVALAGSSKVVGAESGNPALLVNPNTAKNIQISHDIITAMSKDGRLEKLLANGTIEKLPWTREITDEKTGETTKVPTFGWNTDGYQVIDHPSMRDWHYLGKDTGGNNAIMRAQMRIHPEAADYVRQVVGADTSKFRTNPYLKTLMAAQREAKGALLSFSPFHAVQEGLRGVMLGINPFDWRPVDVANDPLLRLGVRNNLTFPDYKAQDMFSEGSVSHSKIIGKIPGLNKIQDYIQEFTFDKLIPSLKARAFKSVYQRFLEKMPGASADEVAHSAATYVNDTFGGQHWRDLGASTQSQDMMRAVALAPDWLTSEIRSLWRAAGGQGKAAGQIARADMTRLAAGMYVTARVVNMLTSGKLHPEAPFGLVVPGKNGEDEKVYSMRTLPTDLVHVLTDPRGFAMGRTNPLIVKTAIEGLTSRDQFGRKVTGQQEFSDFYHNFIPIGGQALLRGNAGGLSNADQSVKALGGTVYKYRTEAERLAQEKASDHMPSGPVDPAQLAAHQRNLSLEDGLRNGEISRGEVLRKLPAREAQTVIQQSKMSPLQARFTRLPLKDALSVWAIATPKERDDLHALLWKKRLAYLQSHSNGNERNADPTWRKLQSVMADLHGR